MVAKWEKNKNEGDGFKAFEKGHNRMIFFYHINHLCN